MISIVIPTYKNKKIFLANLINNLPFFKGNEVIVVNDDPTESIAPETRKLKNVNLIENKQNLGFSGAVDTGIRSASNKYVMLLNSDVALFDRSYEKAVKQLEQNDTLFAVSFAQKENDDKIVGKNRIYWKSGFFSHEKTKDMNSGITAWAEGGACMLNKQIYVLIGGFDPIYSPYYWEDIDLSYRAWKDGYTVLFNRDILVEHHHESTIGKYFNRNKIKTIAYRNQFFFIWKNILDKRLINNHIARVSRSILPMLIREPVYIKALIMALARLSEVKTRRDLSHGKISDQTIISKFNGQK